MKYPFEEFLQNIHAEQYTGTDDDMIDDYENWLTTLEGEDYIGYGNQFGRMLLDLKK